MPGGSWGFSKQINAGNMYIPSGLLLSPSEINARLSSIPGTRPEKCTQACAFYRTASGSGTSAVPDFLRGWNVGFDDAMVFFENGGNTIGLLRGWIRKRLLESGRTLPDAKPWCAGFERGVGDFAQLVGI